MDVKEEDLQGFKYASALFGMLSEFHTIADHRNRELHYDEYIVLILLYFFNPVLTSLRSIQQASTLEKVQRLLKVKAASLGSLSEASQVFDAQHLVPVIRELARQALPIETDTRLKDIERSIVAVDGTLLRALPRMLWALWLNDENRAAKLHLALDIKSSMPQGAVITHGTANEKTVLREHFMGPDKLFVLDAGYAEYKLFSEITYHKSSFVVRIRDNAVWEVVEERPLREEDLDAGVQRDMIAWLGCESKREDLSSPVRIIEVFHRGDPNLPRRSHASSKKTLRTAQSDYSFLLVTDCMDLSAEVIALLYRYRWQIELFFRWFKCVLNCKHLLAQSHNGVSIQVYCALIASMLITLWTGRKPTKRTFEMLSFYFMGWANKEELFTHIKKLNEQEIKKT
jgi:hypothetical protein